MTPFRIALLLATLCAVAAWQVGVIPESLMQMTVGPTLVPAVVVGGLAVLTLVYGVSAWRGRQSDESLAEDQSALPGANTRLLSLLAGGVAFMALVGPLGFIIPGTLCGMGVPVLSTLPSISSPPSCAARSPPPSGCFSPTSWGWDWVPACPG